MCKWDPFSTGKRAAGEDPLEPRLGIQMDCSLGEAHVVEVAGVVYGLALARSRCIRSGRTASTIRILVREVRIRAWCSSR